MAVDPMGSAWAKYHWASKHMERVDTALQRSLDPDAHPVALKVQVNGATAVVRIETLPTLRTELGLALGDVVQNFRAALDHLAWGLVKTGSNPRPANPKQVYFPMAKSGQSFRGQVSRWLPGVAREHRAIIRRYQPYRRGDGPKAMRWLRNLSDTDKHRVLIPAVVNPGDINLNIACNWIITSLEYLVRRPRALHVGTPVLRLGLIPTLGTDCQVQVNGNVALYPSLGRGVPMAESLPLIRGTVFEILGIFDELL